jgi:hypothetical protein
MLITPILARPENSDITLSIVCVIFLSYSLSWVKWTITGIGERTTSEAKLLSARPIGKMADSTAVSGSCAGGRSATDSASPLSSRTVRSAAIVSVG